MPIPSITAVRGVGNFATSHLWTISFQRVGSDLSSIQANLNALDVRCKSVTAPKVKITPINAEIHGHKVYQPGAFDFTQTFDVTLLETTDVEVHNFWAQWRDSIQVLGQASMGIKNDNTADIILTRYHRDAITEAYSYFIYGAYVSSFDTGTLDESPKIVEPKITFAFDYFVEDNKSLTGTESGDTIV